MRLRARTLGWSAAAVLAAALVAWWAAPTGLSRDADAPDTPVAEAARPAGPTRDLAGAARDQLPPTTGSAPAPVADALLTPGLRHTIEAMLLEAGDARDPADLKRRLGPLVGRYFSADLTTRALAMAERYVDYRVALSALPAPRDISDPAAVREGMEARQRIRQQFFQDAEYDALFASEAELDRYTLARLEIARHPGLSATQREQALAAAQAELSPQRRAERDAATTHLAVAAQTDAFNAQGVDERARHAARSAQYGEAAAHALAQLDREEQDWQQRLDRYQQARTQQGENAASQLRQQLFSPQEQLRIDAAMAMRQAARPAAGGSGS